MKKFNLLKSDIKMLFSSMYLCSKCGKEIIRGEGYCDGCGDELLSIKEVGFFGRFYRISFFNKIIILITFVFILSIICGLNVLLIILEFF